MADNNNPPEGEKLSKNAQKKLEKQKQKEEAKAKKATEKTTEKPEKAEKAKTAEQEEEALNPTQYTENRKKLLHAFGENVYPHKFQVTISVPDFIAIFTFGKRYQA